MIDLTKRTARSQGKIEDVASIGQLNGTNHSYFNAVEANFTLQIITTACRTWNIESKSWESENCQVCVESFSKTHCLVLKNMYLPSLILIFSIFKFQNTPDGLKISMWQLHYKAIHLPNHNYSWTIKSMRQAFIAKQPTGQHVPFVSLLFLSSTSVRKLNFGTVMRSYMFLFVAHVN